LHKLTREVWELIPRLEFAQFQHMEDRERLLEIRELAMEQVHDDNVESPAERYWKGRNARVLRADFETGGSTWDNEAFQLWPERTEREKALEAGLAPLLDAALTAEERVQVRLRYDAGKSVAEIAEMYNKPRKTMSDGFARIHRKIRDALMLAYGPREERQ
jgi:hypothetical protein